MPSAETSQHLALKRLSLVWAQRQGFRVAGTEVSLPHLRVRLDAAAFRPAKGARVSSCAGCESGFGPTAIFECKQTRSDFLRDSRCTDYIIERLRILHDRRALYENSMRNHFPSLRRGEALFPEFDGFRFEAAGFAPYDRITSEIQRLSDRLHQQTKFANLLRWRAANLHYVVAEERVAQGHELPAGWGLLVRRGDELQVASPAVWQEITPEACFRLVLRIAMSGTRATNRAFDIDAVHLGGDVRSARTPAQRIDSRSNSELPTP